MTAKKTDSIKKPYHNMIGITERGDAALNLEWKEWVQTGNPAILITKNPNKLHEELNDMTNPNIIIHATITGWGRSHMEPNVIVPMKAMRGYNRLIDLLGIDRVILRVDPIIPTLEGVMLAREMIEHKKGRVRVSILDYYNHIQKRIPKEIKSALDLIYEGKLHAPLNLREGIISEMGDVEVCGEPDIPCVGCISEKDLEVLHIDTGTTDWKQRPSCACVGIKKELLNHKGRCEHGCLYCYWK